VIDIHNTNPTGFTQDDVQIFQTLADQLAIAIQKARYNEEIQDTLNELETAYGTFTRKSWQRFIQSKGHSSGYRFRSMKTEPVYQTPDHVIRAWQQASKVEETPDTASDPNKKTSTLAIPMKVRGEVIGVLNLEFESENIPADTSELVAEIAERLSLIIENARLVETAKNQVDREQLASHISNTIRQSLDMDVVLRTAVQEIGQSLNLPEVEIRLGEFDQPATPAKHQSNGNTNAKPVE
jgi:GAF domain-containing protein